MDDSTTATNNQLSINYGGNTNIPSALLSSDDSLHAQSLPTLPFDIISQILHRLPVKLLLQLRCLCKACNSLITDLKFAKKQLSMSTTPSITRCLSYRNYSYYLRFDLNCFIIGSCNGILCIANDSKDLFILWNPTIRKFRELPLLKKPQEFSHKYRQFCIKPQTEFSFGYDCLTDNYKVIVVLKYHKSIGRWVNKIELKLHTLGTNFWRSIKKFPFGVLPYDMSGKLVSGKFVGGAISWLAFKPYPRTSCFIVAFDLGKESYQKVLLPNRGGVDVSGFSTLGVLRGFLSLSYGDDVWVMKEYGNTESWIKLFTISYVKDHRYCSAYPKAIYIFEDDQVLLKCVGNFDFNYFVYDFRKGTIEPTNFQNIIEVYDESLISPCSYC
ncbi:putative F-box domain-containing protein [Medicago truncatula]|uniref:Putative F-box domain-containing protein n=1 Tax=Medicago truncatula TaxID=3880 RepID=A0A396HNE9_MEDTR|nr:putative F-box domain-containing protein [Medicago truncatula]